MKKLLALLLALSMVLCCFVACEKKVENDDEEIEDVDEDDEDETTEETDETEDTEETEDTRDTEPEVTEPEVTEPEIQISKGDVDADTYSNDFTGLTFHLPEGWKYATDEQIAELMGIAADILCQDEEYLQAIADLTTVYDMKADGPDNSSVMVLYENLSVTGNAGMSEETYISALSQQLNAVNMGHEVSEETEYVNICGEDYACMATTLSANGISLAQNYYLRALGDYMVCIIITAISPTQPDTLLSCFA